MKAANLKRLQTVILTVRCSGKDKTMETEVQGMSSWSTEDGRAVKPLCVTLQCHPECIPIMTHLSKPAGGTAPRGALMEAARFLLEPPTPGGGGRLSGGRGRGTEEISAFHSILL